MYVLLGSYMFIMFIEEYVCAEQEYLLTGNYTKQVCTR